LRGGAIFRKGPIPQNQEFEDGVNEGNEVQILHVRRMGGQSLAILRGGLFLGSARSRKIKNLRTE